MENAQRKGKREGEKGEMDSEGEEEREHVGTVIKRRVGGQRCRS